MKAKELMRILLDKEDFEILLYEDVSKDNEFPYIKEFKLQFDDVGYSEKVIILSKKD